MTLVLPIMKTYHLEISPDYHFETYGTSNREDLVSSPPQLPSTNAQCAAGDKLIKILLMKWMKPKGTAHSTDGVVGCHVTVRAYGPNRNLAHVHHCHGLYPSPPAEDLRRMTYCSLTLTFCPYQNTPTCGPRA